MKFSLFKVKLDQYGIKIITNMVLNPAKIYLEEKAGSYRIVD